jgi:hypothetical protein
MQNIVAVLVSLILTPVAVLAADKGCERSTLRGSYGFSESGTIVGFGAYAAVGTLHGDGKGNLTGAFTESLNAPIRDSSRWA